jgi:hypothetical protein
MLFVHPKCAEKRSWFGALQSTEKEYPVRPQRSNFWLAGVVGTLQSVLALELDGAWSTCHRSTRNASLTSWRMPRPAPNAPRIRRAQPTDWPLLSASDGALPAVFQGAPPAFWVHCKPLACISSGAARDATHPTDAYTAKRQRIRRPPSPVTRVDVKDSPGTLLHDVCDVSGEVLPGWDMSFHSGRMF